MLFLHNENSTAFLENQFMYVHVRFVQRACLIDFGQNEGKLASNLTPGFLNGESEGMSRVNQRNERS